MPKDADVLPRSLGDDSGTLSSATFHDVTGENITSYVVGNIPNLAYIIPDFVSVDEEDYLTRSVYNAPKPKWKILAHRRLQNWGGLPTERGMIPEELPKWLTIYIQKIARLNLFPKPPNHVLVNEYLPGEGIMPHADGPVFYPTISTISLGSHTILDFYHRVACDAAGDGNSSTMTQLLSSITPVPTEKQTDFHAISSAVNSQTPAFSLFVPRRSLIVLSQQLYTDFMHGISEVAEDVITDISVANPQHLPFSTNGAVSENLSANGDQSISGENRSDMRRKRRLVRGTRISLTIRLVEKVSKFKIKL